MSAASNKKSSNDELTRKSTTRQALYRKYRSKSFNELIGQEHITTTLKNAIKSGRISHAYLFTGPRGVGKTSVARILAHEVNKLPYSDDSPHLDIIEIDAASNRRIDEIRDLRQKVHSAPTSAKYKVYIIDEVHMLTREAFNALLKTLEEPPAHCIFILATTEAHKLPETIISRTQRFEFKPIGTAQVTTQLADIAKKEGIKAESEALELLAQYGDGSFRDSISLLDQLSSSGAAITTKEVERMLGLPSAKAVEKLIDDVEAGNAQGVLESLNKLQSQGSNYPTIANMLAKKLRQAIIEGKHQPWLTGLLKEVIEVPASSRPQERLEICLLEAAAKNASADQSQQIKEEPKPAPKKTVAAAASSSTTVKTGNFSLDMWPKITEQIKSEAASLYTALRLAEPSFNEGVLVLSFKFSLHQKKVNLAKNKELVGKIIEELCGDKIKIDCQVNKEIKAADTGAAVKNISNIFGQTEVLESNQ